MGITDSEKAAIIANCTQFLAYRATQTVEERLLEIAGSSYAQLPADGYGSGGMVEELEAYVANLLGKEAAVFMPSGTMAQQIALRIWSDRAKTKRVAFHPSAILKYTSREHTGSCMG